LKSIYSSYIEVWLSSDAIILVIWFTVYSTINRWSFDLFPMIRNKSTSFTLNLIVFLQECNFTLLSINFSYSFTDLVILCCYFQFPYYFAFLFPWSALFATILSLYLPNQLFINVCQILIWFLTLLTNSLIASNEPILRWFRSTLQTDEKN